MSNPTENSLEQRILVFSRAFQDLIVEIMSIKNKDKELRDEINSIKSELRELKLKKEVKSRKVDQSP